MLNHILIVEDDEVTLFLTQTVIRSQGIAKAMDSVKDVSEALEFLNAHQTDVVFLDISLPVMNGFELLEKCRTGLLTDVPFVVLSSTEREGELSELREYPQVIAHVRKPLSVKDLNQIMDALKSYQGKV